MPHKVDKLLLDIVLSCEETMGFCHNKNFIDFKSNRLLQLAIERQFEIMGEALYRLEKIDESKLAQRIPDYRKIIGLRNIIAHGYDIVDASALWDFVINKVPSLKEMAERY